MFRFSGFRGLSHNYADIPTVWSYTSTEDGLAEILVPGYFNSPLVDINSGDYLLIIGNDGVTHCQVGEAGELTPKGTVDGLVVVDNLNKLPFSLDGVYTLANNTTYFITTVIDLNGGRIVAGENTGIIGVNAESSVLKSTGLPEGTPLITSEWSLPLRHIKLDAATIFDLDADGNDNQALDWSWVNLENSSDTGTIANYDNLICNTIGFLGVSGLVLDGTFGTIGFTDTLFSGDGTGTIVEVPSTATITRRYRTSTSAFVVTGSGTGISISASASIPDEGFILDTCNFAGGATYITGIDHDNVKARFEGNRGINNSATLGSMFMQGNVTATVISIISTPVKAAGTTVASSLNQRFTHTNNRLTYVGALTRQFRVQATVNLSAGNNNLVSLYIAKNGTILSDSESTLTAGLAGRLEGGLTQSLVELEPDDYIELYVENGSGISNITVEDYNLIIEALN